MDSDLVRVIRAANYLERRGQELREAAEMSGALPGEFNIVIRMNRIEGRDRLGSMRADYI